MLKIIAALSTNKVIGHNNGLPWKKMKSDMEWFKKTTGNLPVVMGSKTFHSLPDRFKPLPGRENIVLTRHIEDWNTEGITLYDNFQTVVERSKKEDIFVIGGAEIYHLALPFVQEMYLTRVHTEVEGGTFFPNWNEVEWHMYYDTITYAANDLNQYPFNFEIHRRISGLKNI